MKTTEWVQIIIDGVTRILNIILGNGVMSKTSKEKKLEIEKKIKAIKADINAARSVEQKAFRDNKKG